MRKRKGSLKRLGTGLATDRMLLADGSHLSEIAHLRRRNAALEAGLERALHLARKYRARAGAENDREIEEAVEPLAENRVLH